MAGLAEVCSAALPPTPRSSTPASPYFRCQVRAREPALAAGRREAAPQDGAAAAQARMRELTPQLACGMLQTGNRLSITPVNEAEWQAVLALLG